ncbi:orotate phosphoribosyltransferase [Pontibacillus salicampi]|uniref:Orotate phosphoribosyltransferase n=1 Tax=Pontibacillus salicampi TaxID=1449801 RepID=A0ABV6LNU0_9BACI
MDIQRPLAESLYQLGALQVNDQQPFQWTSGILSPVYCDNRLTMSDVTIRKQIANSMATYIQTHFPHTEVIAGCATAGIPHAAWVAEALSLPMVYVRDKPKGHGKQNQIEGRITSGQRAIVVEDLISTGKSSLNCVKALEDEGVYVEKVVAIFTYELPEANIAFEEACVEYYALTNFTALLSFMRDKATITEAQYTHLLTFREDPRAFSLTYQP